jgi:hypothetical protein
VTFVRWRAACSLAQYCMALGMARVLPFIAPASTVTRSRQEPAAVRRFIASGRDLDVRWREYQKWLRERQEQGYVPYEVPDSGS